MSVVLTPRAEALIQEKVAAGPYRNAEELIEEALQALDERDRLARLRAAIAIGDAQIARGEVIPYTSELLDEIEHEVEEAFQRGDRPRADVWP